MIRSISIKGRLLLGFGSVILITSLICMIAIYKLITLNSLTKNLYEYPLTVRTAVLEANADIIAMHRAMKDIAIARDYEQIDKAESEVYTYEEDVYKHFEMTSALAEEVSSSTQEQAATMEEINGAAAMLAELSSNLADSISKFSV